MTNKKPKQKDSKADYDIAPEELSPLKRALAKQKVITAPRLKLKEDGVSISIDHPHRAVGRLLLLDSLGTGHSDFAKGIVRQLVNASGSASCPNDEENLNFMLSVVTGINPNDPIETMIGAQMAAIHPAVMKAASMVSRSPLLIEQEIAERRLTKLPRTFAALVTALDCHRRRSEPPDRLPHNPVGEQMDREAT